MNAQTVLPQPVGHGGQVFLLEAEAGNARRQFLEEWLQAARDQGARTWYLPCDFDESGPWAGVSHLMEQVFPELHAQAPELVTEHDYELAYVVPPIRRTITVRNPTLTEIVPDHERVRNFPVDRAFRIGHGLINLLDEWHQKTGETAPWVVVCDGIDRAGALVKRFFADLARRRGRRLNLTILVATDPGNGQAVTDLFGQNLCGPATKVSLPADPPESISPAEWTRRALALEEQIGHDQIEWEIHVPRLIRYFRQSDRPDLGLPWVARLFSIYTTRGMYEDALRYGEESMELFERYEPDALIKRWSLVGKMHSCHTGLGRAVEAHPMLEELMAITDDPSLRFRGSYMMGMLYARFLPERDLAKAEEWLDRGMEEIARSGLSEEETAFFQVFNRNGLALVRHRQGRPEEGIKLCSDGYKLLNEKLSGSAHRLHKAVLLFNIAQVYLAIGESDEGIRHLNMSMEMDPNYSEYYNTRGNAYLSLGRLEEAYQDYQQAIRLSPPYHEVLANLGNVCRKLGRTDEAATAYAACVDLQPEDTMAWLGLAEAHEMAGRLEDALDAYSGALVADPSLSAAWGNRAILQYELGRLDESVADLNRAIELAPRTAELRYNRATALKALGRNAEAVQDLESYLGMIGESDERAAVLAEIASLRS